MSDSNPTLDNVVIDDKGSAPIEENIKSRSTWMRGVFMCIYFALIWLTSLVGTFVIVLGFLWVLFKGEQNAQLKAVGQSIAGYLYQVARYLTFNTEEKPFPFGADWPDGKAPRAD